MGERQAGQAQRLGGRVLERFVQAVRPTDQQRRRAAVVAPAAHPPGPLRGVEVAAVFVEHDETGAGRQLRADALRLALHPSRWRAAAAARLGADLLPFDAELGGQAAGVVVDRAWTQPGMRVPTAMTRTGRGTAQPAVRALAWPLRAPPGGRRLTVAAVAAVPPPSSPAPACRPRG